MLHLIVDYDGGKVIVETDDEPCTDSQRAIVRRKLRDIERWRRSHLPWWNKQEDIKP